MLDDDACELEPIGAHPSHQLNESAVIAPTSQLFRAILDSASSDQLTFTWLFRNLRRRSFGMFMLLLGLIAMLPGVGVLAGLVLAVLGFQMMMAHEALFLPRFIGERPLSARRITRLVAWIIPVMEALETISRPRWHTPL